VAQVFNLCSDCSGQAPADYTLFNDINRDGAVDFDDIDGFAECLVRGACP
jgi:hypothetical protein